MYQNLTKILQISSLLIIPLIVIQYFFKIFQYIQPVIDAELKILLKFVPPVIVGIDVTLLLLILPWIILIIATEIFCNTLEHANEKAKEIFDERKLRKTLETIEKHKQEKQEYLFKKTNVYLLISLTFIKFTITSLSEKELNAKKEEVKEKLFSSVEQFRGKLVEHENFLEDHTFAFKFNSQEDALNFILRLKEAIWMLDNDIQNFGLSLNYRIMLDSHLPETNLREILEFLEVAINTVENNQICTTNSFADIYKEKGTRKNISFISKGIYSINKIKVELNSLNY